MEPSKPKPEMQTDGLVRKHKLSPSAMTDRLTSAADLFVLAHMGIPRIGVQDWSLTIDGLVDRPLKLSFNELLQRPKHIVETVHQCAGSPMNPTVPTRRIANVRWAGADLAELLGEAGVNPSATHLWAFGLDHGTFAGVEQDYYLKDIPISRLGEGDVLIAHELNDEPLPLEHGFPARLIVPGFFGTNSVKWLSQLHLSEGRAESLFTTRFYNDPSNGTETTQPVWQIAPESIIVSPAADSRLPTGDREIWGWAWAASDVVSVEVSTDGGGTWHAAELEPRSQRSWQRFSYRWPAPQSGNYDLRCRATDIHGETQPADGARNAIYSINVSVGD
ncbi:MAG: molybdopterin-dependent oxidoreductase [Alphaproteobacteria bacterium]|nr:molybdopterin-dependent oxidoreductase [Alphaproteobacteria bacterium]